MRVVIIGAGVIGVATAHALLERGHQITVIERRGGPGEETTHANGGQISASHADPWPSPENLLNALRWFGRENAPLLLRLKADPGLWRWCLGFLANCTGPAARRNTERILRVALHGRRKLTEVAEATGLAFEQRSEGILHIFRDPEALKRGAGQAALISKLGCPLEPVDRNGCLQLEPALAGFEALAGGYYCADDLTGNAYAFTAGLAAACAERGVRVVYDASVAALSRRGRAITGVETTHGTYRGDAYVIAAGCASPHIVRTVGLRIPVYPAKGYSVTVPIRNSEAAPVLGIIDDGRKHVYSRLGDRLRIAGMVEIGGFDARINQPRAEYILDSALEMFPGFGDRDQAEFWAGLRPQTPDSVPIIGRTVLNNLFLNTGHGTLGWTMACGAADIVANVIENRAPAIDVSGLELKRFLL